MKVRVVIEGYYELPDDLKRDYEVETIDEALKMDQATFLDDPYFCLQSLAENGPIEIRLNPCGAS